MPLLTWAPGRVHGPIRIDAVGSQADLFPILMDIVGLTGRNHAVGTSLPPGRYGPLRISLESVSPSLEGRAPG